MKHTTKDMRTFGIAMAVVLSGIAAWQFAASRSVSGTVFGAVCCP